jgi:hypothetical protein
MLTPLFGSPATTILDTPESTSHVSQLEYRSVPPFPTFDPPAVQHLGSQGLLPAGSTEHPRRPRWASSVFSDLDEAVLNPNDDSHAQSVQLPIDTRAKKGRRKPIRIRLNSKMSVGQAVARQRAAVRLNRGMPARQQERAMRLEEARQKRSARRAEQAQARRDRSADRQARRAAAAEQRAQEAQTRQEARAAQVQARQESLADMWGHCPRCSALSPARVALVPKLYWFGPKAGQLLTICSTRTRRASAVSRLCYYSTSFDMSKFGQLNPFHQQQYRMLNRQ